MNKMRNEYTDEFVRVEEIGTIFRKIDNMPYHVYKDRDGRYYVTAYDGAESIAELNYTLECDEDAVEFARGIVDWIRVKYQIQKDSFGIENPKDAYETYAFRYTEQESEIIEMFDDLEIAKEALSKYLSTVKYDGERFIVEEFYIIEQHYDEDDIYVGEGDFIEFARNNFGEFK